jgi:hypothetical protein
VTFDREREVTEMVALYISNEGADDSGERIAFRAAAFAKANDLDGLSKYVKRIILTHRNAREVRNEMAKNDWDRVNWKDVADELEGMMGRG